MQSSMNISYEYESPNSRNKFPQIQQRHIGEWICVPHVLRSYTGTLQRISLSAKVMVGSVWRPLCCHCRQMGYVPIVHMIQSSYTLRIYNWSTNSTTKSGCVGGSILRILVYLAWHFCCPYSEDRQQLKNSPHIQTSMLYVWNFAWIYRSGLESCHKKGRKISNVATSTTYGFASSSWWSKSVCNLEMCIMRFRGSLKNIASFKGGHFEWAWTNWLEPTSPKGKPPCSHMVGWKYLAQLDTPTMIGWTKGDREIKC